MWYTCGPYVYTDLELGADVSDVAFVVNHLYNGQFVSLPTLIVIVVVSRRDLHGTRAKPHLHHFIRHDRQLTVTERMLTVLANQML